MDNYYYSDINRRLKAFIDRPASNHFLSHISHQASLVIPCHHTDEQYRSSIPPLPTFVNLLAKRSGARTGTLLASLVLLDRLRQRLAQFAKGMPCTCQRIFLATLIVTTKMLHDTSPKNKHWTKYAVYFTLPEVNLMEKQLLALMNYQLIISKAEMLHIFTTYDNTTTSIKLPPIIQDDRLYLPKSASFNSPSPSINKNSNSNNSLSNIILQQQHYNNNKHYYYNKKKMTNRKNNKKRLNISASTSSSSLSSLNSMDDVYVVTPTTNEFNYNHNSSNNVMTSTIINNQHYYNKKQFQPTGNNNNEPSTDAMIWLDQSNILPQHYYHHHPHHNHYYGNIVIKN